MRFNEMFRVELDNQKIMDKNMCQVIFLEFTDLGMSSYVFLL